MPRMRDRVFLLIHLIATIARLLLPGGARSIIAESLLLKHQLLILNRSRSRAPNLRPFDRVIAGLCTDLIRRARLIRTAIVLRPSTLMRFHEALVKRKYRWLFTPKRRRKPGPKAVGPDPLGSHPIELLAASPSVACRSTLHPSSDVTHHRCGISRSSAYLQHTISVLEFGRFDHQCDTKAPSLPRPMHGGRGGSVKGSRSAISRSRRSACARPDR